jgi:DNA-binding GntR family transcriptional regulator
MSDKPKINLVNMARQTIERHILEGVLRPDQHLVEVELSQQLGISRTPLREALRQLEIKGYLTKRRSVGYVVTRHTTRAIREVMEVRIALETLATKLACDRATEEQLIRAETYLNNYDHELSAPDISTINFNIFYGGEKDWNTLFHREIYDAAGNKLLASQIDALRNVDWLKHVAQYFSYEDLLEFQKHHYALLNAIKERDKNKCEITVTQHMEKLYHFYSLFMETTP